MTQLSKVRSVFMSPCESDAVRDVIGGVVSCDWDLAIRDICIFVRVWSVRWVCGSTLIREGASDKEQVVSYDWKDERRQCEQPFSTAVQIILPFEYIIIIMYNNRRRSSYASFRGSVNRISVSLLLWCAVILCSTPVAVANSDDDSTSLYVRERGDRLATGAEHLEELTSWIEKGELKKTAAQEEAEKKAAKLASSYGTALAEKPHLDEFDSWSLFLMAYATLSAGVTVTTACCAVSAWKRKLTVAQFRNGFLSSKRD